MKTSLDLEEQIRQTYYRNFYMQKTYSESFTCRLQLSVLSFMKKNTHTKSTVRMLIPILQCLEFCSLVSTDKLSSFVLILHSPSVHQPHPKNSLTLSFRNAVTRFSDSQGMNTTVDLECLCILKFVFHLVWCSLKFVFHLVCSANWFLHHYFSQRSQF